ncbi:MAG: hypothetical protein IJ506_07110 [Clostridia bacterium]|nr:hypothetical protein [Clostridia bacterium]
MGMFAYFKRKIKQSSYARKKRKCGVSFPLYCKAHGVKRTEYQGALAQSRSGDKLQLIHNARGDYPYNVYIYSVDLNRILGYLHETLAYKLVTLFGAGFCRDAVVKEITGGGEYKYRGCNIEIFETMEYMKDRQTDLRYLRS